MTDVMCKETEGDAMARVKAVYPDADWHEESKWWAAGIWRKTHTGPMKIGEGNNEPEAWSDAASKLPQPERPEPIGLPELPEETQEDSVARHNRWVQRVFSVIDDAEDDNLAMPEGESSAHAGMDAELELLQREQQLRAALTAYESLKQSHTALVEALDNLASVTIQIPVDLTQEYAKDICEKAQKAHVRALAALDTPRKVAL